MDLIQNAQQKTNPLLLNIVSFSSTGIILNHPVHDTISTDYPT